ncbi:recombinase family protein [Streptomyces sp. NBC_00320]|uniref:recombinase family protein n=1 Tax=Streptomyces sp. NBC_00320 TaxID=2975711 RepID=UPI00225B7575|nr:recombinase family protein [Streptomyces sp. NBC_00320]MCX5152121.1 recombinase family protein [Streptomyces sp. NBC_00320]
MSSEKISTCVRVRPQFEAALALARQIKAHAPHCRVIFTVYEMKRLGRDATELTALADHLTAHGSVLEMLAGPLPGMYDPSGPGRLLFAFFAAMAETERENIRESTLDGLDAAARKGKHGGRPPVITEDMPHTALGRRANGESVEQIQPDLIIPIGKRKGLAPSVAQHLPGSRRTREDRGGPRSRRGGPRRLRCAPERRRSPAPSGRHGAPYMTMIIHSANGCTDVPTAANCIGCELATVDVSAPAEVEVTSLNRGVRR